MNEEIKEKLEAIASDDDIDLLWNEANDLLNYITNLQKENEKLKEKENFKFNIHKDETKVPPTIMKSYKDEYEDYKSRNEKAVEYIKERKDLNWYADGVFVYELLNILQGGDE